MAIAFVKESEGEVQRVCNIKQTLKVSTDILTSTFQRLRLRGIAAGIAGDTDADDALHDAFCGLWARHRDVESSVEAIKLSYAAVRNSAIDLRRRAKSHPMVYLDEGGYAAESPEYAERERRITYQAVLELSRRVLSERQFEIFNLHDIEGVGYEEIAMRLSMSQESVRMALSRARKAIRELYRQGII